MHDDDLTTLLRDAGAEPTRGVDADEVHAVGRRRATVRRGAVAGGALVLLAALAVSLPDLLRTNQFQPDVLPEPSETVTATPSPTATGSPAVPTEEATGPTTDGSPTEGTGTGEDAPNVTGVGSTLVSLTQEGEFGPVTVTSTAPDGGTSSYTTRTGPLGLEYGIAVDGDGRVVYVDEAGVLTRADAASTAAVRSAAEGPWRVVGPRPDGDTWITRGEVAQLWVLTDTDVVPDPSGITASMAEGGIARATSSGDTTLAIEVFAGEGGEDWRQVTDGVEELVHRQGPIGFPQDDETDFRVLPTFVEGELWWVHQVGEDAPVHDLQVQTADGAVLSVPSPVGRDGERRVLDVTAGTMPDGGPALLLTTARSFQGEDVASVLVDVAAARAAATAEPADAVPDGVFTAPATPGWTVLQP